ncbi:MAG: phage late control D family protein [Acidobacteria bacterium]|nr:phage late control D family protein [Acidobacteriota bacterium]
MEIVTLGEESASREGFYVPVFQVKIEGVGLPRNVLRDVTQITYKDNVKELDSFELTVNNWDAAKNTFKYVGAETADSLQREPLHRLFEPCNKEVVVSMGYGDYTRVMLTGTFTTMEPNFPAGGAPTLTVRGLNVLHQLRRKQYTFSWENMTDSKIAEDIAGLKDKDTKKNRFPLPIKTDPNVKEPQLTYLAQKNQYDIDFLLTRARARGYVVFVHEETDETGKKQKQLYFGPSESVSTIFPGSASPGGDQRDVTFVLEWGRSLIDFKPTLTTANQIKSVTVNGWDRKKKEKISESATLDDPKLNRNQDLYELLQKCDPREEVVVDEPVFTKDEAKKRALAILNDKQKEMVKATGTTVGLPDLRAGRIIQLDKLGSRFSGIYFVTETTHTIGPGGYTTKFSARRENPGENSAA